jgi:hypothetical protein
LVTKKSTTLFFSVRIWKVSCVSGWVEYMNRTRGWA